MGERIPIRSDRDWIDGLLGRGTASSETVAELEAYLRRILARVVGGELGVDDVGELVQESLTRMVKSLSSFRGDSAFPTWAAAIATRVALTELRRRRVRETDPFDGLEDEARELACPHTPDPGAEASARQLRAALDLAIRTRLTERQRVAILAELRGVPTIEIAERLGTNQNALYKLTHDARKKLRGALEDAGFSGDHIRDAAAEVTR